MTDSKQDIHRDLKLLATRLENCYDEKYNGSNKYLDTGRLRPTLNYKIDAFKFTYSPISKKIVYVEELSDINLRWELRSTNTLTDYKHFDDVLDKSLIVSDGTFIRETFKVFVE